MKAVLLLTSFFISIVAPESARAEVLTWSQCVGLAGQQNADLKTAREQLRSNDALVGSARSGYLPSLSGTLSAQRSSSESSVSQRIGQLNAGVPITASQTGNEYTASLSLTENLFNGFADVGRVQQAKANTRVAQSALQTAFAQLSYDLKVAYQGYLYASDAIVLSEDIIKRRNDNMRLVQLRFESGNENKGSVLLAQAYYADAKFGELQSVHAREVARTDLAHVLGLDDKQTIEVQGEIPKIDPSLTTPDLKALATETPLHVQAIAKVDASAASVKVARAGFFPKLNFSGAAGRTDTTFFPQNDNWSVGLNLTFPFFDGASSYYTTQSAQATLYGAQAAQASVDQKLLATLRQAYTSYVEAVEKVKVDESYKNAAILRAEIARSKYNNGLITFDAWDVIENDLIARQRSYIQSVRDRVVAEAAWEQAQGKGVF